MKNKFLVHSLLAIAMTCASFVTNASPDGGPVFHEAGGLAYASGGVGEESRQLLSARASEFNLKLVFAMTSGAYTSGVRVAIADAKGKTLLEATSDGPWFLAKLPVGQYRVVASYAGKAREQSVALDAIGLRTVDFRWSDE
ncbi:MAG: carboxypeptidase regulatory-like domain-containing protein [Candidatus Accumulibacter sp.]|uniref:carboxypeptidase-like regulatory domain-containing protein n=1 Tax=Accumulibacter sp. TaxID=2053492 RepID=UPI001A0DCFD1|nr:carboxypeptidase-like regulatory domain-containing protein [Accumulibacter sp.]MBE2258007.1 carboxypeptidase regulatory-like domain-containing protein [Paracoccaceae bacterium]MCP5248339.1 carboxypeptidase regulatory-like domain-containing protein [Accumulibacter sp.]